MSSTKQKIPSREFGVALKIPYAHLITEESLDSFRREVRLVAKLEHPHIQPLKYADFIDGHFVIVTALGLGTLDERLSKRLSAKTAVDFARQMIRAIAFAHENKIIHCDVKPDNFLLFPDNQLRLTDFGIARVAHRTLKGSGAGTVGYVAPEQAMGSPSFRSDVFSLGLLMHRMFTGKLPAWPFTWPFVGHDKLQKTYAAELVELIRKSTELEAKRRYRDGVQMLSAFERIRHPLTTKRATSAKSKSRKDSTETWKEVRFREFQRKFRRLLETCHVCSTCDGPVSEPMLTCPWCGTSRKKHTDQSIRFPVACPRCRRGLKSDWKYCPWCFGAGFEPSTTRQLTDRRYIARCSNPSCSRKDLMAFMRYCPWCKVRVKRKWKLGEHSETCGSCGWGIASDFWTYCPWCSKAC